MKDAEYITLGTTLICLMVIPTFLGIKLNHPIIGIVVAGVCSISYLIKIAMDKKND